MAIHYAMYFFEYIPPRLFFCFSIFVSNLFLNYFRSLVMSLLECLLAILIISIGLLPLSEKVSAIVIHSALANTQLEHRYAES